MLARSLQPAHVVLQGSLRPVIKTKATREQLLGLLKGVPACRSALLVDSGPDARDGGEMLRRGARNLPWVTILPWYQVRCLPLC